MGGSRRAGALARRSSTVIRLAPTDEAGLRMHSRREYPLLLARPRGFCAGMIRAIETVRAALQKLGPPVYVRKEIVHNHDRVEEVEVVSENVHFALPMVET
jgi:hypothetical protein